MALARDLSPRAIGKDGSSPLVKPLKLHWAATKPNFGDWLSPALCGFLSGRKVVHAKITQCDLAAVGSLLQRKREGLWQRQIHFWGSGFIQQQKVKRSKHIYHAVRGALSAGLIGGESIQVLGDPGLLIDQLLPSGTKVQKKHRVGVIPHYKDTEVPALSTNSVLASGKRIDVFQEPLEVAREIQECELILSSSLHGLVVADALGVPNQWLELSGNVRGGGWKFHDYYSAFGLKDMKPMLPGEQELDTLSVAAILDHYQRPGLDDVKEQLTNAFPFSKQSR